MKLYYGKENAQGMVEWEMEEQEKGISRNEKWIKSISIKYQLYKDLNTNDAFLKNNSEAVAFFDSLITFTEAEKQSLLYNNIRIHWLLFGDGDFEVLRIDGKISDKRKREIERQLNAVPFMAPFFREGIDYDMTGFIDIRFDYNPNYNSNIDFYVLNTYQLGWLNCDIFLEFDAPKINMLVKGPPGSMLKVLFKNYNSIVSGYESNEGYVFANIPEKEPIEILAMKYADDFQPLFSLTEAVVTQEVTLLPPQPISIEALKSELDAFN